MPLNHWLLDDFDLVSERVHAINRPWTASATQNVQKLEEVKRPWMKITPNNLLQQQSRMRKSVSNLTTSSMMPKSKLLATTTPAPFDSSSPWCRRCCRWCPSRSSYQQQPLRHSILLLHDADVVVCRHIAPRALHRTTNPNPNLWGDVAASEGCISAGLSKPPPRISLVTVLYALDTQTPICVSAVLEFAPKKPTMKPLFGGEEKLERATPGIGSICPHSYVFWLLSTKERESNPALV